MSYISKCDGEGCPRKEKCYRYMAPGDGKWQSWFSSPLGCEDGICPYFDLLEAVIKMEKGKASAQVTGTSSVRFAELLRQIPDSPQRGATIRLSEIKAAIIELRGGNAPAQWSTGLKWRTDPLMDTDGDVLLFQVDLDDGKTDTYIGLVDEDGSMVDSDYGADIGWRAESVSRWILLSDVLVRIEPPALGAEIAGRESMTNETKIAEFTGLTSGLAPAPPATGEGETK